MGVWGGYPMDQDAPYSECVSETWVRDGIDAMIEASSRVVIPAFLEECCSIDWVPRLLQCPSPQIKNERNC
jgi:hypothetical protein